MLACCVCTHNLPAVSTRHDRGSPWAPTVPRLSETSLCAAPQIMARGGFGTEVIVAFLFPPTTLPEEVAQGQLPQGQLDAMRQVLHQVCTTVRMTVRTKICRQYRVAVGRGVGFFLTATPLGPTANVRPQLL